MQDPNLGNFPRFEKQPLTRSEYISAMVHLYRGELNRANTWRLRLDTTTNWAIIASMGILSFAFGVPEHSHASMIFGMYIIMHFLTIEARRFRFFDVWRTRVRMIEENFYGPMLKRTLESREIHWGELVAGDLLRPSFKITYPQALRARFSRNYAPLFVLLLIAWFTKIVIHPQPDRSGWVEQMGVGPVSGWFCLALIVCIYLFLLYVLLFVPKLKSPELQYFSPEEHFGHIVDY